MRYERVANHKITRPANPHRSSWDEGEMNQLMDSITQLGVIQPILLKPIQGGYEIIAGDRRLEANRRAGNIDIPALISEPGDLLNGEAATWAENLNRADLPPMDQARQVHRMRAIGGLAVENIAQIVNRTQTWVQQRLDLYALPSDLTDCLEKKQISIGAALALGRVTDAQHRAYLTRYTSESGAAINVVRDWIAEWEQHQALGTAGDAPLPPMPEYGQPYVIMIPCWLCHAPHDHNHMLIHRVCRSCTERMQYAINNADAAEPDQPQKDPS